eukprot:CAMPEP_0194734362 /NCGR_PEP_ID=MMETSP0296-20130528/69300_1 /TAXON_ID=39354 /ORGANISM="Heterosigma akashiwo, Strain CCMP2393" /LENGTH=51 /DNA_ID=CAMNT_0039643123 /DNA_START=130 /DNA_END=282 /DNA_ORIENTATION=+
MIWALQLWQEAKERNHLAGIAQPQGLMHLSMVAHRAKVDRQGCAQFYLRGN